MIKHQIKPEKRDLDFIKGTKVIVEATQFELSCLREIYAQEAFGYVEFAKKPVHSSSVRYRWDEDFRGLGVTIGEIDDMPVCLSLRRATVNGEKILFWEPTSQMVDHLMIDKWFADVRTILQEAWYVVDPTNFHNAFLGR